MAKFDLIVKGGTVIDGLQTPRYRSDIAVKDGLIVEIGGNIAADQAMKSSMRAARLSRPASSISTPTTTASYSGIRGARCRVGMVSPAS